MPTVYSAVGGAETVFNLGEAEKMKHYIFNRSLKKKTKWSEIPPLRASNILMNGSILVINILKDVEEA